MALHHNELVPSGNEWTEKTIGHFAQKEYAFLSSIKGFTFVL